MKTLLLMLVFFLFAGVLSACTPPVCCRAEDNVVEPQRGIDEFVGLWNSSTKNSDGDDIIYTRIMRNGDIIEYDFDGDKVDKGLDCYTVETGALDPRGNQNYVIQADMHDNVEFLVSLNLIEKGQALKVVYLEPIHKKDTNRFQSYTELWQRVWDDSFLNHEPSCQTMK